MSGVNTASPFAKWVEGHRFFGRPKLVKNQQLTCQVRNESLLPDCNKTDKQAGRGKISRLQHSRQHMSDKSRKLMRYPRYWYHMEQ